VIAKSAIPRLHAVRLVDFLLLACLILCASVLRAAQTTPADATAPERIIIGSGMTHLLDLPVNIERVSVAAPETAEAVPVTARSLMINGKLPGETSVVIWLSDGSRREYDVDVKIGASRIQAAKEQVEREFGNDVQLTIDNGAVYVSGRLRDMYQAQRAVAIAATVGKVVNLLKVDVPPQERQILLKVRFANVDRSKSLDLGVSFVGAPKGYPLSATVGTYASGQITGLDSQGSGATTFTLSDALNLFLFDPHLNLGATIKDLANRNILQILAEPNLLTMNGKDASFLAGGEFPYPTLQGGGAGVGQVTVQFQEFGIRLRFLPTITPRGTIRLRVAPEVSSLDYSNALSTSSGVVPALSTRRIDTEVELQSGQSFAIAGLLNNQTTESLSKIPGLADIPVLGKLFTTKTINKQNSELLVIVTPELVEPIPQGESLPELPMPQSFIEGPGVLTQTPRTPGTDKTGPLTPRPARTEISVQEMEQIQRLEQQTQAPAGAAPVNTLPAVGVPGVNMPAVPTAPAAGTPDASGR
jgi:pilus assembly protein CpaC